MPGPAAHDAAAGPVEPEPVCACCALADCTNGRHCDGYESGDVLCCGCGRVTFRWRHPLAYASAGWRRLRSPST
jgi:hypothetical protein